jgi:hypothetical protein
MYMTYLRAGTACGFVRADQCNETTAKSNVTSHEGNVMHSKRNLNGAGAGLELRLKIR